MQTSQPVDKPLRIKYLERFEEGLKGPGVSGSIGA